VNAVAQERPAQEDVIQVRDLVNRFGTQAVHEHLVQK